jgi:hypothetical protein
MRGGAPYGCASPRSQAVAREKGVQIRQLAPALKQRAGSVWKIKRAFTIRYVSTDGGLAEQGGIAIPAHVAAFRMALELNPHMLKGSGRRRSSIAPRLSELF